MSVRPLWVDAVRTVQLGRLRRLELQVSRREGLVAWHRAQEQRKQLPEGVRVDLPSPRVLGAVLGLWRSGSCLKRGRLETIELALTELAELVGVSKSVICDALRWLGCDDWEAAPGVWVRALGYLQIVRRAGPARVIEGGVERVREIFRTSKRFLTELGQALLGLTPLQRVARYAQRHERRVRREDQRAAVRRELERPPPEPPEIATDDERARGAAMARWVLQEVLG